MNAFDEMWRGDARGMFTDDALPSAVTEWSGDKLSILEGEERPFVAAMLVKSRPRT
jgi:hypothetical protein